MFQCNLYLSCIVISSSRDDYIIIIIIIIIIITMMIIIYKTFIVPMLEFRALYSYVNRKNKIKMIKTTKKTKALSKKPND